MSSGHDSGVDHASVDGGTDDARAAMLDGPKRKVIIVMLPVKELGLVRRSFVQFLSLFGSLAALNWCMHWAIIVQDSCFELQRFPERPRTRLRSSQWNEMRRLDQIEWLHVGHTSWSDLDITTFGNKYFEQNSNLPYDLFMNNCQTFVSKVAQEICSNALPEDRHISLPLHHVLSYAVARIYCISVFPVLRQWYRFRGCDRTTLLELEQITSFWAYWLLPMLIQQSLAIVPVFVSQIDESLQMSTEGPQIPRTWQYMGAVIASPFMISFFISQQLLMFWVFQPRASKVTDGHWRLLYRPNRVPVVDGKGLMRFKELGAEPNDVGDRQDIANKITAEGRFPKPDVVKDYPFIFGISGLAGLTLTMLFWSYRLFRHILKSWTARKPDS